MVCNAESFVASRCRLTTLGEHFDAGWAGAQLEVPVFHGMVGKVTVKMLSQTEARKM